MLKKKIFFIFLLCLGFILVSPVALAADKETCPDGKFCLNVPIGGLSKELDISSSILGQYLTVWYNLIIGAVGVLATVMVMYGGFKWLTSRGNSGEVGQAKEIITSAIIGMVLAFLSFTILYLVNPRLTRIEMPKLDKASVSFNSVSGDYVPGSSSAARIPLPADEGRERDMREYLRNNGVEVNAGPERTQVGGMQPDVAQRVVQFSNDCAAHNGGTPCDTVVTGGNEHGNAYHQGGQAADFRPSEEMNSFIEEQVIPQMTQTGTTNYDGAGNNYPVYQGNYNGQEIRIIDERAKPGASHWHIEFR